MTRTIMLAAGFALAVGIGFVSWAPGGRSIAMAEIRQALAKVKVVHITGGEQTQSGNQTLPLVFHKDKWLRCEPLAVFESNTPSGNQPAGTVHPYILAGNKDLTYWYFPDKGKAVIAKGLTTGFLDEILSVLQPFASNREELQITGHTKIDGREVDLMETSSDGYGQEIAIDPQTKLACRFRQFKTGANGSQVMVTDLKFEYDQAPPEHVFDWQPPQGANIKDKRP